MFYTGIVENRIDPLRLGRCQVRIHSLHTDNKTLLPTQDLPWSYPIQPITSAAISGIGHAPLGPVEGTTVIIIFRDPDNQQPMILGTVGGIPQDEKKLLAEDDDVTLFTENNGGSTVTTSKNSSTTNSSGQTILESDEEDKTIPQDFIGPLSEDDFIIFKNNLGRLESSSVPGGIINTESQLINTPNPGQNYGVVNPAGYVGKYQIGAGVLKDLGYLSESISNHSLTSTEKWTGKNKVSSYSDLLIPEKQETIIYELELLNYKRLKNTYDVVDDLSSKAEVAGWLTASHFGIGNAVKLAKDNVNFLDGNGTSIKSYYDSGYSLFSGGASPDVPIIIQHTDQTPVGEIANGTLSSGTPNPDKSSVGFSDPNAKYPLVDTLNEPDTNRLARGSFQKTVVTLKESLLDLGVPIAIGGSWNQPKIPYNSRYPFNNVFVSEAGHIEEFDNTPNNERYHLYHKAGTYREIDVNGTLVDYIVGDQYMIINRNGNIHIKGTCNLTIDGDCNLLVQSNANIEVFGNTKANFRNDLEMNVSGSMSLSVADSLKIKSDSLHIEADTIDIKASGALKQQGEESISIKSSGIVAVDGSFFHMNSGLASSAEETNLSSPGDTVSPINPSFGSLVVPDRNIENEMIFESEDESDVFSGSDILKLKQDNGTIASDIPINALEETTPLNRNQKEIPQNCALIYNMEAFPRNLQLSANFNFSEIVNPQHTLSDQNSKEKNGISRVFTKQEIVCSLKTTCDNILEKILTVIPKSDFEVTSSYRQTGIIQYDSSTSDHQKGRAVDIQLTGAYRNNFRRHYDLIIQLSAVLNYDQLILEYRDTANGRICWIHISYNSQGNRKEGLTLINDRVYANKYVLFG